MSHVAGAGELARVKSRPTGRRAAARQASVGPSQREDGAPLVSGVGPKVGRPRGCADGDHNTDLLLRPSRNHGRGPL